MSVKVLYFGSLRERMGKSEIMCDPPADLTVAEVWTWLDADTPRPDDILCSINQEYVKPDAIVRNGDELAFFPKVTGG
ncbi:MAG: MoaD/ThiS family protein [Methylococcaceae bacterium]